MCLTDTTAVTNQQINSIVVDTEDNDPAFVYYRLLVDRDQIGARAGGAATPIISKSVFEGIPVSVPPLRTQRKIAAILSAYDDLIENNNQRIKLLEEMAQRIYHEWFVDFRYPGHQRVPQTDRVFGKFPHGWIVAPLHDSVELLYGKALKADDRRAGPVPVFGSGGQVGLHDHAIVGGPGIIVGRKGNVGSVIWSDVPFYPIDTTFYVKTRLPMIYVYFALRQLDFIDSHAAVPGLNRDQAYGLPFVVPNAQTLAAFERVANLMFSMKRNLEQNSRTLRTTRDLLLPRLISGEVDVDDLDIQIPDAA